MERINSNNNKVSMPLKNNFKEYSYINNLIDKALFSAPFKFSGTACKQFTMFCLLVFISTTATAQQEKHLLAGSSRISTQGLGGELNMTLGSKVELMAGMNIADVGFGFSDDDQDYDATLHLNTLYTGMRVHPWANGLYVGGAVALNNNQIKLKPKAKDGKYHFNGKKYDADAVGSVKTTGSFFKVSPMLLAGWESKPLTQTGMSFFGEVGVMISTPPSFELSVVCSQLGASTCDTVKRNFRVEQESAEEKLIPLLAYPIVGAGVRFRF